MAERHVQESELALRSIIEEFASPYARLPKPAETVEGKKDVARLWGVKMTINYSGIH